MKTVIESGVQLLARLNDNSRKSLEGLENKLFPEGLQRKETVEIIGNSGSGKTLLLTQLISTCILPIEYKGFNISVLLINTDHHFQIEKLVQIMQNTIKKINENFENQDESKLKDIIEISLKNLLIINCTNNFQFICNLYHLSNILNSNSRIDIVAIDSISAFYWQDREMGDKNTSINSYISNTLNEIQKSTFQFNVKMIYTKDSEFTTKGGIISQCVSQPTLREINHRINLSKEINLFQGLCRVESTNNSKSFNYKTTELGLKWLESNEN